MKSLMNITYDTFVNHFPLLIVELDSILRAVISISVFF